MDWFKKKNPTEPTPPQNDKAAAIAQAQANMRQARSQLGDETIQKLAAALQKLQEPEDKTSPVVQAKKIIRAMDKGRVADELKSMLKDQ